MADVDFLETNDDNNPHIDTSVIPEGVFILTGNDVVRYFRSAANPVYAGSSVADFTVTLGWVSLRFTLLHQLVGLLVTFCWQFTGSIDEVKQSMMLHLDDAYRAARGLYFTQKEVFPYKINSCVTIFLLSDKHPWHALIFLVISYNQKAVVVAYSVAGANKLIRYW